MSKYGEIKKIETIVRSSIQYTEWTKRNKAATCLNCNTTTSLELHHIVELHFIIMGLWKLYGSEEDVIAHALALHQNDLVDCVTFCDKCHAKRHPGRSVRKFDPSVRVSNWTVLPRNLSLPFSHSTLTHTQSSIGLIGFQVLLAIGWYILNGHIESRMIEIHRRRLAEHLDKTPGTSFDKSLDETLKTLQRLKILIGHHRKGNNIELHMAPEYLKSIGENPWFIPLDDAKTSNMCVLTLRWFLSFQSNKKTYKIGLEKLKSHLGITVQNNAMAVRALKKACNNIKWASLNVHQGMCTFSLTKKGATPIFSLRRILTDALEQGC